MAKATWLADVLRIAGLNVKEADGWQSRGRPGSFGPVRGVMLHHTGAGSSAGLLSLITRGRPDLPGPLSHLFLDRDGTYHVVAAGRCNHAGNGRWQGTTLGNASFIGIEAANDGVGEEWPDVQMEAYEKGVAAILDYLDADAVWAVGHKEWSIPRGRKIDPTFDMAEFRDGVEAILAADEAAPLPSFTPPSRVMLKKGDNNSDSVRQLQRLLNLTPDGDFGPITDRAVRDFQRRSGLLVDGKVGPKTWAALGVK